jgi:hypothetical protein
MNVSPRRIGAITEHHSHDPSSARMPGYGRGCLTVSWCLVFYDVYTKIERNVLLWEIWVDFPYLICIFYIGKMLAVIKCIYLPPTYLHFIQDIWIGAYY